ncbi:MAG: thiamine diphosphokinase [Erysipelotrichaceae bacterium]|nr:thiamine diphosphokinase [Erysipelotrichaceae bacterium]
MRRAIVCLGNLDMIPLIDCDVIGVDKGAELLAEEGIPMVYAIGDFDSTSSLIRIQQYAKEIKKLPVQKNETDSEAALLWAMQYYDHLDVYGGLQGRLDHEYANLSLLIHRKYPITLYDRQNKLERFESGMHHIYKNGYQYLSLFPLQLSTVTLNGVLYPLTEQVLRVGDIYTISNEILQESMELILDGEVLMIQSNDDKKRLFK